MCQHKVAAFTGFLVGKSESAVGSRRKYNNNNKACARP